MTNNFSANTQDKKLKNLAFLYLAKLDLDEAARFAGALLKKEWVLDGNQHVSMEVRALDIAVIITYSRPFKKSFGFGDISQIWERAMLAFTTEQQKLHDRIIEVRDREYAHADAAPNDIELYLDGLFLFSKRVTREPLQHFELNIMIEMCRSLVISIDEQIQELRSQLINQI